MYVTRCLDADYNVAMRTLDERVAHVSDAVFGGGLAMRTLDERVAHVRDAVFGCGLQCSYAYLG